MNNLEELKKVALAATPGPWEKCDSYGPNENGTCISAVERPDLMIASTTGYYGRVGGIANTHFIALANPAVILDLIAQLEAAQKELSAANEKLKGDQVPVDAGIFTRDELAVACKARVRDMPENYADHQIAKVALRSLYTAPQKPVLLLEELPVPDMRGDEPFKESLDYVIGWNTCIAAIKAGGKVEGE